MNARTVSTFERFVRQSEKLDVTTPEYGVLLDNMDKFARVSGIIDAFYKGEMTDEPEHETVAKVMPIDKDYAIPDEQPEAFQPTEPEETEEAGEADTGEVLTLAEVREKLNVLRKQGVNIAEVLKSEGYDTITAVPEKMYGAIIKKAEAKANA